MKTVFCRKYQKDLPKMDRAPFPGEKGEEIYSSVSKQAWMDIYGDYLSNCITIFFLKWKYRKNTNKYYFYFILDPSLLQ